MPCPIQKDGSKVDRAIGQLCRLVGPPLIDRDQRVLLSNRRLVTGNRCNGPNARLSRGHPPAAWRPPGARVVLPGQKGWELTSSQLTGASRYGADTTASRLKPAARILQRNSCLGLGSDSDTFRWSFTLHSVISVFLVYGARDRAVPALTWMSTSEICEG